MESTENDFESYKNWRHYINSGEPIAFDIINNGDKKNNVYVLGYDKHVNSKNYGNSDEIVLFPKQPDVSYFQILSNSAFHPYETECIVLETKNKEQLKQVIEFCWADEVGKGMVIPLIVQSYLKGGEEPDYDEKTGLYSVVIPYRANIDNRCYFRFVIHPNTILGVFIYKSKKSFLK